ncbi:DNA-binding transcriptional regulator, LysR family [Lentzea fradiae]|uniref:DNA-binding transcriptional regulator, LysR family n=1 Tax=Lentzea fradiae TaxID=200378 RepID=A0A1G7R089_9PSEU|nr:LysR substrate-binding domain-containing protein [Lentzea fradiae]SDG04147.1 DNA-binding transcriptional regulator, LysR family [Lentzea fradiae]
MDLRQLRYFVAVAEECHFGRAAARLHMAQPPLSQQIRTLEDDLGVQLLRRTTRRVELTEAGAAYLDRARKILAAVDDAGHEARRVAAGSVGRLAIGCVGSATYSLLPALARGLSAELPGVDFAFRGEMLVPDQVRALRSGDIDIALLRPPVADTTIAMKVLRRDRLVAALPSDHALASRRRLSVAKLRDEPFIVHSGRRDSVMFETVLHLCRAAGFDPAVRHEVDETSTLVTLVAGGLGVAIVPEPVSALRLGGVVYVPLSDRAATSELAVAHLADRAEPHLQRAVNAVTALVR